MKLAPYYLLVFAPAAFPANLPLPFERNVGQGPAWADAVTHAPDYLLALSPDQAALFPAGAKPVRVRLAGANARARVELLDPLPGKSHYFRGNDPSAWRRNVPQFRRARIVAVYPGIDMTFYGREGELEYDFDVQPGADPRAIEMELDAPAVKLDSGGDLVLGPARLHAPVIYQRGPDGERQPVRGAHRLVGANRVRFDVEAYDRRRPLVIDPVLTYSATFTGGRPTFTDMAVDAAGNTYVTGCAASGMPLVNYYLEELTTTSDAILVKFSPDGQTLLYSTYFGGGCGSAIALDSAGNVSIAGTTANRYFPLRHPAFTTQGGSFLTKFTADGSELVYSTYLGGDLTDAVAGLAVDSAGNAYVTGRTRAANFRFTFSLPLPSPDAGQPQVRSGFVEKFSPEGKLVFSANLGPGLSPAAIAVDAAGAPYVGGATCGERYPVATDGMAQVPDGCDAFVAKLLPDGSAYNYRFTFGGDNWDGVAQIGLDAANDAFVSGVTFSPDFPTSDAAPQRELRGRWDAFVAKVNPAGDALLQSTYLGGSGEETPLSLAVDPSGRATVAGTTTSGDFPLVDALRAQRNGAPEPLYMTDDGGGSWSGIFAEGDSPWRGSLVALAATPDPLIVYSASRFAVQRSADGGLTWKVTHARPNRWQLRGLLGHPSDPNTIYALSTPYYSGTAPANTNWTVSLSTDGGATFGDLGAFAAASADRFQLSISAADPSVLYALVRRRTDPQLFRSADGGNSWTRAGALPDGFQSLALDPSTTNRLYGGFDGGIFVTEDGGASWNPVAPCPNDQVFACQYQELYVDASGLYFLRRGGREYGYTNQQLQVWRSGDAGANWSVAQTPVIGDAAAFAADGNAWYLAFTGTNGLYRSADRGQTWTALAPSAPFWTDTINALAVLPLNPTRLLVATSTGTEGFFATLSSDGASWVQSTWLGGPGNDTVGGLHADDSGWFLVLNNAVQRMEASNGGCDLALQPATLSPHYLGSSSRIQVRTGSDCRWAVDNPASWISVVSPLSGSGSGAFELVAAANPGSAPRSEALNVNGQTLAVTQPGGPPCTLTPDVYRMVGSGRFRDGVAVNYTLGCRWEIAKDAAWVTLDSPVNGTTTSMISYTVEANPSAAARKAVLTFSANGGASTATHTILQPAPNCKVNVTASADRVPAPGGTVTLKLESTPADCSAWAADSGASWAVPMAGTPAWGAGNGSVTFTISANNSPTERTTRLQMGGMGLPVTQSGVDCTYTLKPATQSIDSRQFQALVTVAAPANCTWTALSNNSWLRITSVVPTRGTSFSSTPTGNGRVYFTASANDTGVERTGTITVGGQAFTITQAR